MQAMDGRLARQTIATNAAVHARYTQRSARECMHAGGDGRQASLSRRKRGMFDQFIARDLDGDGDMDLLSTRGNSAPYDGVFWLEQVRTTKPTPRFTAARSLESEEVGLP